MEKKRSKRTPRSSKPTLKKPSQPHKLLLMTPHFVLRSKLHNIKSYKSYRLKKIPYKTIVLDSNILTLEKNYISDFKSKFCTIVVD
jgi:hypothetical protein